MPNNPYPDSDPLAKSWLRGFRDARSGRWNPPPSGGAFGDFFGGSAYAKRVAYEEGHAAGS